MILRYSADTERDELMKYSNFIPDVKNNIVIFYYKKIKDYDFEEKTRNYKYYYNRLDMYNENM